jgi:symplekin
VVPASAVEEDDDYEPDYEPVEDAEQVKNRLEMESSDDLGIGPPKGSQITLGPFKLPLPQQLGKEDLDKLNYSTMERIFGLIDQYANAVSQKSKPGFNRLAASSNDRQSMIINFIRLITRPSAGISEVLLRDSNGDTGGISPAKLQAMKLQAIGDRGRQQLLHYIMNDWTHRMDIATTWLTEEWYNDLICSQAVKQENEPMKRNFAIWAHRFLDELSVYISHEHQNLLIRFVSEVPGLDADILNKIKRLALDPERIVMTVKAFQ